MVSKFDVEFVKRSLGTYQKYEEDSYEGKIKYQNGEEVSYVFSLEGLSEFEFFRNIANVLKLITNDLGKLKISAAKDTYDLYKNTWAEDKILSFEEFKNKLRLSSISLYSNGGGTLYFECGDLFGDHSVTSYLDKDGKKKFDSDIS